MNVKNMIRVSLYSVIALLATMSSYVQASCVLTSAAPVINIPSIVLSPSEKGTIGTVLFSMRVAVPGVSYTCGSSVKSTWRSSYLRPELSKSTIDNVYNTSIQGIGIRMKWPESRTQNSWVPGSYSCQGSCIEPTDKILIEFVQTGNASGGTISAGDIVEVSVSADNDPQNSLVIMNMVLGEVVVKVRSCAIYASTNSIDLGEYSLADAQTGGFLGDKKDFTITLDCPDPSVAKITFDGRSAWGMSSGVIANAGDAQSAYIKLHQKSGQFYSEVPLNTITSFGSNAAFTGKRTITYAGEMYFDESTRSGVTAGSVRADVVYTLTIN